MKAVFHVSERDSEQWSRALGNILNLLDDPTVDSEKVALVVNSAGVDLLKTRSGYGDEVTRLSKRGVDFLACRNTLTRSNIAEEDLYAEVRTVPSAMGALTRLQHEGYAYIKP